MKAVHSSTETDPGQAQVVRPSCPRWKKALAGGLAVVAVMLVLFGTAWLDHLDLPWTAVLGGLALNLLSSIGLVLAGILLVTALLWLVSRSRRLMNRGRSVVEYVVHCYPQQIKARILHPGA